MFQNFVIFLDIKNTEDAKSILSSGTTLRGKVFKLVMNCLNDLQIEVRVKSAQVKQMFLIQIKTYIKHLLFLGPGGIDSLPVYSK